jgi:hypothetical protein
MPSTHSFADASAGDTEVRRADSLLLSAALKAALLSSVNLGNARKIRAAEDCALERTGLVQRVFGIASFGNVDGQHEDPFGHRLSTHVAAV